MRGDEQVIAKLNEGLRDELTAINQYFVHAEMCHESQLHQISQLGYERYLTQQIHGDDH